MITTNSEYNTIDQHIGMFYMASGDNSTKAYGNTPKEAADAYVAKYPRLRKPFNVNLVHEYRNGSEISVRFGTSWPQWRKLTKKTLDVLPTVPFTDAESTREIIFSLENVCLFHTSK